MVNISRSRIMSEDRPRTPPPSRARSRRSLSGIASCFHLPVDNSSDGRMEEGMKGKREEDEIRSFKGSSA